MEKWIKNNIGHLFMGTGFIMADFMNVPLQQRHWADCSRVMGGCYLERIGEDVERYFIKWSDGGHHAQNENKQNYRKHEAHVASEQRSWQLCIKNKFHYCQKYLIEPTERAPVDAAHGVPEAAPEPRHDGEGGETDGVVLWTKVRKLGSYWMESISSLSQYTTTQWWLALTTPPPPLSMFNVLIQNI